MTSTQFLLWVNKPQAIQAWLVWSLDHMLDEDYLAIRPADDVLLTELRNQIHEKILDIKAHEKQEKRILRYNKKQKDWARFKSTVFIKRI